ncbi:FtsX-like permease family protein [Cohnella herbarum]|uniref:ABC transporter permease n=1 Tax=Cohnella herbarum TaxID=2728023 RepID=A0A7Z2VGW3_9BACL|nr:ABC transporter permease [Cohnella herbarum]QJD82695.1 ABC transporter permease [Cohnella herbarum]
MTFRQFAFNNVLRNKRTYAAYFLSSAFSVMAFFVYAVFAFHPDMENGNVHNNVSTAMHFAEGLIYAFSFFFVLFSMSAFLKTRKKEFGLMVMLGMTDTQLRGMVFLENVLIGLSATVTGIGLGLVMAKLMLLSAENLLGLDESLPFYMPLEALGLTFAAFLVLFVVISMFTVIILRGNKLIDLIKGSNMPKKEPKASRLLSLFAIVLLGAGYAMALIAKGMVVFMVMIPVTLMVIVGTYFLFTQLSVYVIGKSRNNRSFFWRKTNMLFVSDLAYRMKDNARTFFMVSILSTVAFSAIGSLVGFKTMVTNTFASEQPFAFEYTASGSTKDQAQNAVSEIEKALNEAGYDYKLLQASMSTQSLANAKGSVYAVKAAEFNAIATAAGEKPVDLKGDETVMVYYDNPSKDELLTKMTVVLENGQELVPVSIQPSVTYPISENYYVLSDERFERLKHENMDTFYAFDVAEWKKTKNIGKMLEEKFSGSSDRFISAAYELAQINQVFGIILFIGLFIGAVFFVASGSFLYFRLYADMPDDKAKFKAITKLGLTDRELSSILTKQLLILFFVPIGVAFVHGAVALTSMQRMFEYSLIKESFLVLGTFVLIQAIYFLLIRSRYIKQVSSFSR